MLRSNTSLTSVCLTASSSAAAVGAFRELLPSAAGGGAFDLLKDC